jgi:hypothetical protein
MEKWITYAALLNDQIIAMFEEDSENPIDIKELQDEENLKAFFHALSTVMPCQLFNQMVKQDNNILEYNHITNSLVFEYATKKED